MNTYCFKTNKRLQPYISQYWGWEGQLQLPCMLPGTGAELMFLYGSSLTLLCSSDQTLNYTKSILLLPRHQKFVFKPTTLPIKFIAIRFRHHALRHFCAEPIAQMIDHSMTAEDIWGNIGLTIENQIQQTQTIEQKIDLLEHFLLTQLQLNHKTQHPWLNEALYQLYYQTSEHTLDSIIEKTQLSTRYFQKVFKTNMGVSPKYFQKTARFEHMIKKLLLTKHQAYLDCALAHGYYDQSHFIKDFKEFTGQPPLAYLQDKNNRTHFYNAPLLNSSTMPFLT